VESSSPGREGGREGGKYLIGVDVGARIERWAGINGRRVRWTVDKARGKEEEEEEEGAQAERAVPSGRREGPRGGRGMRSEGEIHLLALCPPSLPFSFPPSGLPFNLPYGQDRILRRPPGCAFSVE